MLFSNESNKQAGVAALLLVVIISSAALLMAYSAALLGLGELDMGYTFQKGSEALAVADGCLEETLRRIRLDNSYGLGAEDIALSVINGSCIINVDDISGGRRMVNIKSAIGDYYKKIEAEILLSVNAVEIDGWRERDD